MNILYDGITSPQNIVTFNGIPNILTIEATSVQGSKAELTINVVNLSGINLNTEYSININGAIIKSSTTDPTNKRFYITNANSASDRIAVASSIVRALRASALVNYEIYQVVSGGILTSQIKVEAREIGQQYAISFETNLGAAITSQNLIGSTTDEFNGSQICVDIYQDDEYITTLQKSYYKDRIDFNISQVLTTISRYDFLTPYSLIIYSKTGTKTNSIGYISGNYSAMGYMVNQGEKYLNLSRNQFAQNVSRGDQTGVFNKTTLYVYQPSLPFSIYSSDSSVSVEIHYKDANYSDIRESLETIQLYNKLSNIDLALETEFFNQAAYVDLIIPEVGTIRYNVIKPLDATSRCQRVYYHNSYGGVSFFDFTGQITENHTVDNETYTKNINDYYRTTTMESTKIYSKTPSISVVMKSHLMERSGVWQFNDLLGSFDVWTNINGVDYKIIVTDCKVEETTTGVWEATVTYTYSYI